MPSIQRSFWDPLIAPGRTAVLLWGSVLILSTLKIIWGDEIFFLERFGEAFEDPLRKEWWSWGYAFAASFVLFACLPVLIQRLNRRTTPSIGLGLGDHRFGIKASLIAMIVLPLPAWISSKDPAHLEVYPLSELAVASTTSFLLWNGLHLLHYIGWEIFYRGFIGLGMRSLLGSFGAMSLQVILTTLMHIDKPNGETLGAFVGGFYLGLLTLRTGSVWYAVFFHAYLGALNTYFCA
jgi:membrane protease YdiL (CAAX protease family)